MKTYLIYIGAFFTFLAKALLPPREILIDDKTGEVKITFRNGLKITWNKKSSEE
jgi:hypothetical protein